MRFAKQIVVFLNKTIKNLFKNLYISKVFRNFAMD